MAFSYGLILDCTLKHFIKCSKKYCAPWGLVIQYKYTVYEKGTDYGDKQDRTDGSP